MCWAAIQRPRVLSVASEAYGSRLVEPKLVEPIEEFEEARASMVRRVAARETRRDWARDASREGPAEESLVSAARDSFETSRDAHIDASWPREGPVDGSDAEGPMTSRLPETEKRPERLRERPPGRTTPSPGSTIGATVSGEPLRWVGT